MTQHSDHENWRPSPVFLFLFILIAILSTACYLFADEKPFPPKENAMSPVIGKVCPTDTFPPPPRLHLPNLSGEAE